MKILICGYIGGKNAGDEAICHRLTGLLQRLGHRPTLLSLDPGESARLHGAPAVGRRAAALPHLMAAIARADLVILGGGTLLQTATSGRSALYYLSLAGLSALFGCPWILLGGVDSMNAPATEIARLILPTAHGFFLRSEADLARAARLAPAVPRFLLPDLALLPPPEGKSPSRPPRPPRPYGVICPKSGVCGRRIACAVARLRRQGLAVIFLPLARADEALAADLARAYGGVWISLWPHPRKGAPSGHRRLSADVILGEAIDRSSPRYYGAHPCEVACRILAAARRVYSARLHGLLFARSVGTPYQRLPDGSPGEKFAAVTNFSWNLCFGKEFSWNPS